VSIRLGIGLVLALAVSAQEPRGSITGLVADHTGAVIPNASVKATNLDTGVVARTSTNAQGSYEIPFLLPGPYKIEVEAPGFKSWLRQRVELRMEDTIQVDAQLEVGNITEVVTVSAEAPLVESTSGGVSQVMGGDMVSEMPLRSGSVAWAYAMAPGVVLNDRPFDGPWNIDQASNVSIAGSRGYGADFNVDGVSNNSYGGRTAFVPPADMVQEVRVNVTNYDASLGRATGASVNVSLKSGTNRLQGSIQVAGSGGAMMTRNFFTNRFIFDPTTGPVTAEKIAANTPSVRWMRYSAAVGGPLAIPRVYNGRNRTFWMFGYQTHDRVRPNATSYSVPTVEQRRGDFSALLALGSSYQIYDPATTVPADGGRFRRQPFAGNIIPASRIHAVSQKVVNYFPAPNVPGTRDFLNNFNYTFQNFQNLDQPVVRIDHNLSERHRFFGRYAQSNFHGDFDRLVPNSPVRGRLRARPYRGVALDDVLVLSNSLVLDLRYGFTWFQEFENYANTGWDLREFGFPQELINLIDPKARTFPQIVVTDMQTLGNVGGFYQTNYSHSALAVLNWIRGKHSVKSGFDGRGLFANEKVYDNATPRLEFGETYTRGPLDNSAVAPTGQGLASFLLGLPTGGYIDVNDSRAASSKFFAVFIQDDWRVSNRLTVNLGLRWEYETTVTERFNRFTRDYDFQTVNPIQAEARAQYAASPIPQVPVEEFRTIGGVRFAGREGAPRGLREPFLRAWMPRVGFAWRWKPTTVVRGGYGIYYDLLGVDFTDVPQSGYNQRTNTLTSTDNGQTYVGSISNPFPFGAERPKGASGGLRTYLGRAPAFFSPDGRRPYAQRWNLALQFQPLRQSMVELGYLASRGVRVQTTTDFNPVPRQYLSTSPVRDQAAINFNTAAVNNPFRGISGFEGSNWYTQRTVQRNVLLKPYPHFSGLTAALPAGATWYHALTARFERRLHAGLRAQVNYTWSKFMQAASYLNPTDEAPEHVIGSFDRPHRIAFTAMYNLPFGPRARFFSGARGVLAHAIGGWQAVAVFNGQSGPALSFGNVIYNGTYPEIRIPVAERTVDRWFNTSGFVTASGAQLGQNIRTFPTRISAARADGINVWDLSLQKVFQVRDRYRLQFRAQAEGAMNHPNFGAPNTTVTSTLFGKVTATQGGGQEERRIFLGLKFLF